MKNYIDTINRCFKALGSKRKSLFQAEKPFYNSLRRSLYFRNELDKNHIISKKDIIFLRPFSKKSIKNTLYKSLIGKRLKKDVLKGQIIEKKFVK